MLSSEIAAIQYLVSETPSQFPNFSSLANDVSLFEFDKFLYHEPQQSEENQTSIIDERKQRRMISNRESARRSRMRKQRHLDELWAQVVRLKSENHYLVNKLNHMAESHDKVLAENKTLREEVSDLRKFKTKLQLDDTYCTLKELEEVITCNTNHLSDESSDQSII